MSNKTKFNPVARRWSRRLALQAIYQWQMTDGSITEIATQFSQDENMNKSDTEYFREMLAEIPKESEKLDQLIQPCLEGRKLSELDSIELAILRMGTYELSDRVEIPYRVVINEAVELAKKFGATDSYKYVNAVLDKLAYQLRQTEITKM